MEHIAELISGLSEIINEKLKPIDQMLAEHSKRLDSFQSVIKQLADLINEHDEMLRPPPVTGLPPLRDLAYMALTFYHNQKPGKGTPEYNLKIEANRNDKFGNVKKDFTMFATLYHYEKFRKSVAKFTVGTEAQRENLLRLAAPFSANRNVKLGLLSTKGGAGGTSLIADQLAVLVTKGEGNPMDVDCAVLMIGDDKLPIDKWHCVEPKTGNAWGSANIVARAFPRPKDYFAELDEDAACNVNPEGEA